MTDDLLKTIKEMKQIAEKEPFRMSVYNPLCDPKMNRQVIIDGETLELVFTLDEYPMVPQQIWHLSVTGKISNADLLEMVRAFYSTGDVFEIPREELVKLGYVEKTQNQRQFCQIKA